VIIQPSTPAAPSPPEHTAETFAAQAATAATTAASTTTATMPGAASAAAVIATAKSRKASKKASKKDKQQQQLLLQQQQQQRSSSSNSDYSDQCDAPQIGESPVLTSAPVSTTSQQQHSAMMASVTLLSSTAALMLDDDCTAAAAAANDAEQNSSLHSSLDTVALSSPVNTCSLGLRLGEPDCGHHSSSSSSSNEYRPGHMYSTPHSSKRSSNSNAAAVRVAPLLPPLRFRFDQRWSELEQQLLQQQHKLQPPAVSGGSSLPNQPFGATLLHALPEYGAIFEVLRSGYVNTVTLY
jgi:Uncharacterised protein family (UPF0183)